MDFIISKGQDIIPVEVKSTASGHLKSLFYFVKEKKNHRRAIKISLADFKVQQTNHKIGEELVNFTLINLPLYAIENLR